jgi:hypothetical protein
MASPGASVAVELELLDELQTILFTSVKLAVAAEAPPPTGVIDQTFASWTGAPSISSSTSPTTRPTTRSVSVASACASWWRATRLCCAQIEGQGQ